MMMPGCRRRLVRLAGGLLAIQLCSWIVTPTLLYATTSSAALACSCSHGGSHNCPVHHHNRPSKNACSCRDTSDGAANLVASLIGPVAVLVAPDDSGRVDVSQAATIGFAPVILDTTLVPDAPPPRA